MVKTVCIIGGGPTGMRVAERLCDKYDVSVFEKSSKLGGCWKIEWMNSYFTEHSPRVISTGYKRFFEKIKDYNLEAVPVYNTTATGNRIMFATYIYSNLSFLDLFKFLYGITFYSKKDKRTVQEWMDDNSITEKGQNGIKKLCIAIATVPEYLSWVAMCLFFKTDGVIVNLTSGDYWLKKYEKELKGKCNLYKNVEVNRLHHNTEKVNSIKLKNGVLVKADYFIVCIPTYQLYSLFDKSNIKIENWDYDDIIKASYTSIGFQLHFDSVQQFPDNWCNSCMDDWSIIMLNTSKYYTQFTKDPRIKDVYSCTIIDTFTKSQHLGKSVNDLTNINDIIQEALRQISNRVGYKIKPYKVTVTSGLKRKNKLWQGKDSAFSITPKGTIPTNTTYNNLFTVGPHNLNKISVLEGAFESADLFCDKFLAQHNN